MQRSARSPPDWGGDPRQRSSTSTLAGRPSEDEGLTSDRTDPIVVPESTLLRRMMIMPKVVRS